MTLAALVPCALRRRILLVLNMNKLVQHAWQAIRFENTSTLAIQIDREHPIRCTGDMQRWFTRRPNEKAIRCHINACVYDGRWEASVAQELGRNPHVTAWVKNDHLGFEVLYVYQGVIRKYRPDFLIRLTGGKMLVKAVNEHGGFGRWASDVATHPHDLPLILEKHNA